MEDITFVLIDKKEKRAIRCSPVHLRDIVQALIGNPEDASEFNEYFNDVAGKELYIEGKKPGKDEPSLDIIKEALGMTRTKDDKEVMARWASMQGYRDPNYQSFRLDEYTPYEIPFQLSGKGFNATEELKRMGDGIFFADLVKREIRYLSQKHTITSAEMNGSVEEGKSAWKVIYYALVWNSFKA
jgi:hypothetical protein